jgi:hypothetical protein
MSTGTPIAARTPAYPNGFAVRVSANLRCPVCGRAFRASDVDVDLAKTEMRLVCGGCDTVVLTFERR